MRFTMQIPRAHTRPPNQNHRECGLKICILNKQVILFKVYEPLLQGESTQREALAEECDFGGRGIRARQWGRNKLRGPEVVRVKTRGLPKVVPSPVSSCGWDMASCLRVPPLPSLLLWLFPFSSFIGDQLTVWAQTSPFLGGIVIMRQPSGGVGGA